MGGDIGIGPIRAYTVYILEMHYRVKNNISFSEKKRAENLIKKLKESKDFEQRELEKIASFYESLNIE